MFRKSGVPFIILIILGSILRLLFIGRNDIWYDEAFTVILSRHIPLIWNPPLYFIFIKIWITLFGISELALRLPSALFSIGSLFITYLLAKKMFDGKTALLALAILIFSPFHIWYAQEARNYSLALFLGLLSSYFLYLSLTDGKRKNLVFYVFSSALSLYSNYFCIVLFFSQILFALFAAGKNLKKIMLFLLPSFFFLPWLTAFLNKLVYIKKGFWIPEPDIKSLSITLGNFIFGYNGTKTIYTLSGIVTIFLVIFTTITVFKKNTKNKELAFCVSLSFLPLIAVYAFSKYFFSIYLDRGFLMFSPYFYILLAVMIGKIRPKALKPACYLFLLIPLLIGDFRYFSNQIYLPSDAKYHVGTYVKKPFKPLTKFLKENLEEEDFLVFGNEAPTLPIFHYMKPPKKKFYSFYAFDPEVVDTNWQRPYQKKYKMKMKMFFVPKEKMIAMAKSGKRKVFFVGCDWPRSGGLDENSTRVKEQLDKDLTPVKKIDFDGIMLSIYEYREKNS